MRYFVFFLVMICLLSTVACDTDNVSLENTPSDAAPTGTFTGKSLGLECEVTFKGNKMTAYNEIGGKVIYEYALMRDGVLCSPGKVAAPNVEGVANQILLRDHAMGTQQIVTFEYLPSDSCVVIDGQRYYK